MPLRREVARVAVSSVIVEDFLQKRWAWSRHRPLLPVLVGVHDYNAVPFLRKIGGYVMLHCPHVDVERRMIYLLLRPQALV